MFYGCDLAASEDGQTLVESLSTLTGADVAASTDDTGHAIFGADWELEYTAGQIETSVAFSQNAQDNWGHLLNVAVDATSTGATTGNSLTISHMTSGTSRLMLVGVSMDAQTSASVTSVTYNGSALSLVGTIQDTGSNVRVELWQMVAPATGTHDVVVSFSQSMTEGGIAGVMTFNGVDQTTPLGSFASAQGIGTTASVNVSTDVGDLVFSTMGVDGGTDDALNHAAGQTEYWETFQPGTEGAGSTKLATSTSETMSWTFLSNQWAIGAVSIKSVANTEMQMITGSYVGDGVDGRGITGLGFDPDLVIIKQGASGQNTVARTSAMTGDVTKSFVDGIAEFANGIESLNGDGFTVGTDATVNSSGQTYYWTAFKAAAGEMSVGSYTGDGLDDRSITGVGFQADYAIVMGAGAHESVQRFQDQSGDASLEVGSSSPLANVIQAFEADGFQVGSDSRVNQSGQDYYYVAWKEVAGKTAFGTYTGDDADNRAITDVGFQPEYVLTRMEAGGDSVHRPDSLTGDNTLGIGSDGAFADGIQQYLPTGFEVGSHIIVNWSGQTYYYAAFNADDLTTTVTVDTTADYASGDLNYGDTSSIAALIADKGDDGLISLREAIDAANNQSGLDTIEFNIAVNDSGHFYYSDDGVANQVSTGFIANTTAANDGLIVDIDPDFAKSWYSIAPSAALPDITDAIIIDGTTQPGYTDSPIIELNGSGAGASANGLTIEGGNSTIRGLVINEFDVSGIRIDVLGGNTIAGNYIGTDVSGTLQVGSDVQDRGIYVLTSGNTIGGTTAADRNVISGNRLQGVLIQQSGTTNNQVTGNYIGTTADGSAQLANVGGGQQMGVYLWDTPANTIGGTADGAGNVISGNLWYGVYAWGPNASGNMIQGNTIGMDAAGSTAIGNGSSTQAGIYIASASGNTIGGVAADAGNLIAGNPGSGIIITGTTPTGNSILSNSIHTNGKLGVDLDSDGITFNDVDDVDLGANESLNFAVITDVTQNGADLDVTIAVDLPTTNTSWYRVEFFENPNGSDSTGHGEGEILLDAATIQVTGAAGYETFNVTLSGVTPTQILGMSVTVTEDTSAGAGTTFGSTSEFGPSYLGAGILEVTTTSDDSDGDTSTIATLLGDRGADGEISLREAMEAANSTSGAEIHFRIDTSDPNYDVGSGTWLIQPGSALPFMNNAMTIDARTQTGYAGTPLIDLDGTNAVGASGFVSDAGNIHIHGFAIRNFDGAGIELQDGTVNSFMGNYIGTDVTGTVAHANNIGIYVIGGAGNTTIGGSVAGSGNLISGNTQWGVWLTSDDNTIAGNLIGTNASGLGSLANLSGIFVDGSFNNTIGGTTVLERNVISGNTFGVIVSGAGANNNNLYGNYIGVDVNGTTNLGNTTGGVAFGNGADGNRVGGTLAGQGNVISGNGDAGILIDGSNDNLVQGNLIGTDAAGTGEIGNDVDGIRIVNAAADNLIGGAFADAANTIANNTGDGVRMDATAGLGNSVLSNLIYSNTGLGIDLEVDGVTDNDLNDVDAGANNVQNFPVITQADLNGTDLTVSGTLDTDWANTQYRIEFFGIAAGDQDATNGEGRYYLGTTTITTSPTADGSFSSVTLSGITLVEGDFVTATATKIDAPAMVPANELLAYGNTSEFAANVAITDVAIAAVNDVPTFGANGDGSATTAIPGSLFDIGFKSTVQNDGKLIVVGSSFFADNNISVARFNVDGTLDLTFGGGDGIAILDVGGSELAVDVAVQSDGKIVVLGTTDVVADSDLVVARFNADGTLDTGFDGDGYAITDVSGVDNAGAVAIQTDDKIVIAGANAAGGNNFTVVRYDTDGSLDTSFDTDGIVDIDFGGSSFDQASAITIQTDGMIVVGGVSDNQYALARLTVAGALDTSFDTDGLVITDFGAGNERISDLIVQSDGKIVAGGTANLDFALARYNTDGSLDTLFDTDGMQTSDMGATEQGYDLALTSSEKIVISGYTDLIGSNDVMVQRYNSDGSIDATFNTVGTVISVVGVSHEYGYSVDVLADDSVVVGGYSSPGGFLLNKYNEDGTPDTSFAPTTNLLDGNPTFVEDGSAVVLDADVEVFDQELSGGDDFGGATLTLARNGGAAAEDVFSATGNLVFNAGTLELSATNIGSYTNAGGQLDLTFAAGTTNAQVNEVMQSIAYANTSDSPPSSVQINWTFSDGNTGAQGTGGALAALGATTVDITPTNDPPTATIVASAFGIDEDDPYRPFGGFSVADIDAGTSDLAVTLTVSDGVINLTDTTGLNFTSGANDSASMTFTGTLTELNNALATFTYRPDPNFNGTDVVTLSVDDLGNTGGGSLTDNDTANIVVSPLPDDPVANDDGGVGYTTNEETSFTTGDVLANDTDADIGDTLSVQSIDTTGTLGTVLDNGDGTFDYDPNGQFEYLAVGETATDTFTYTVRRRQRRYRHATVTITINGVNDTPTADDDFRRRLHDGRSHQHYDRQRAAQ